MGFDEVCPPSENMSLGAFLDGEDLLLDRDAEAFDLVVDLLLGEADTGCNVTVTFRDGCPVGVSVSTGAATQPDARDVPRLADVVALRERDDGHHATPTRRTMAEAMSPTSCGEG